MATCSGPMWDGQRLATSAEHEWFDYGNKLGTKAGCIAGLKKSRYNNNDFGTVVMSSYAAPHTSLPSP